MAKYIVKPSQNIFDIAIQLHGSIEGVFDLLISNRWLNCSTVLEAGMEIEYHDGFVVNKAVVESLKEEGLTPSNTERHVYHKPLTEDLVMIFAIPADLMVSSIIVGGEGVIIVDWGDNSELEIVDLSHTNQTIEHYYDNVVEKRRVKVYGDTDTLAFTYLNTTGMGGTMYVTKPITVDKYVSNKNGGSLDGLFLFEGAYHVDLKDCVISDLMPIADMRTLQTLDLRGVTFSNASVLDDYLLYIRNNYGTRGACTVYLDAKPSDVGMKAIQAIISEQEWNYPIKWVFNINGTIYTAK